jgi:glycosyl hydrolase family 28/pectate lyase-like protein
VHVQRSRTLPEAANPDRRAFLTRSGTLLAHAHLAHLFWPTAFSPQFDVRNHGAKGDGVSRDTRAIQAAIDAAGHAGGTVYFPPGEYVSGTLRLRGHITVHLGAGATLVASSDDEDFDPPEPPSPDPSADAETADFRFALLQGEDLSRVSILGLGRIDGHRKARGGPKLIALRRCRGVQIRDLTLMNAPNYNISLLDCERVDIVGVTIRNGYSDGIDPDCCRHVRISHCYIESRDDAVAVKTSFALGARRATEDVEVTRCDLVTMHNALKLGTESTGDFTRIVFSHCTILGRAHPWQGNLSSGVSLVMVDGGHLQDVRVSEIRMANVRTPLFIRLGGRDRARPEPAGGALSNVSISNLTVTGALVASSVTGLPGHPVSGISLTKIQVKVTGGFTFIRGFTGDFTRYRAPEDMPEQENSYPDAYMWRRLPAYGFYCRHVRGLTLDRIDLDIDQPDKRSAVVLDDVHDATVQAMSAGAPAGAAPLLFLRSVQGCRVNGVSPRAGTRIFLRLSGADTTGVRLATNDLSRVERVAIIDEEVAPDALRVD